MLAYFGLLCAAYWATGSSPTPCSLVVMLAWMQWQYGERGRRWRQQKLSSVQMAAVLGVAPVFLMPLLLFFPIGHVTLMQGLLLAAISGVCAAALYLVLYRLWPNGLPAA